MSEAKKVKRVPLYKQDLLIVPEIPGFKTALVFEDKPGEVDRYLKAGYVVVEGKFESHDNLSQVESQFDSVYRRVLNKDPLAPYKSAILMKIPLEHYEEDQQMEQAEIDAKEKAFDKTGEITRNTYGNVSVSYKNRT